MEGPISFWGYKEQELNLILLEHDDNDDDIYSYLKCIVYDMLLKPRQSFRITLYSSFSQMA